jgi:hypothetical protein
MTISATDRDVDEERLRHSIILYRDLSGALIERITQLKQQFGKDPECKDLTGALVAHHRALQTVLDIEARIGKRTTDRLDGAGLELDFAAARAEILARLAGWVAGA